MVLTPPPTSIVSLPAPPMMVSLSSPPLMRVVAVAAVDQVVAVITVEGVVAAAAEQLVGRTVAVDDVVERVAGAVDGASPFRSRFSTSAAERESSIVGFDACRHPRRRRAGRRLRRRTSPASSTTVDVVAGAADHACRRRGRRSSVSLPPRPLSVSARSPPLMMLLPLLPVPTNWSASTPL